MNKLGQRPQPSQIKFSDDCFQVVGTEVEYLVILSALNSGPKTFKVRSEAEELARITGREVTERTVQIKRRIKWF